MRNPSVLSAATSETFDPPPLHWESASLENVGLMRLIHPFRQRACFRGQRLDPVSRNLSHNEPNLLSNPTFEGEASVAGSGIWFWDETEGHDSPGSTSVVADGAFKKLMSNAVAVSEGQMLHASVWSKWSGLTYTGLDPIKLQIVGLLNYSRAERSRQGHRRGVGCHQPAPEAEVRHP
jgi:hypothetical protein